MLPTASMGQQSTQCRTAPGAVVRTSHAMQAADYSFDLNLAPSLQPHVIQRLGPELPRFLKFLKDHPKCWSKCKCTSNSLDLLDLAESYASNNSAADQTYKAEAVTVAAGQLGRIAALLVKGNHSQGALINATDCFTG